MTAATSSLSLLFTLSLAAGAFAQQDTVPVYLRDRGTGVATSMFGTYVRQGELLIYPFFEYYRDNNLEYKPVELGYGLNQDFRGKYRASEGLLWIGYGLTDWLAVEFEAAGISATLYTAPGDTSGAPLGSTNRAWEMSRDSSEHAG